MKYRGEWVVHQLIEINGFIYELRLDEKRKSQVALLLVLNELDQNK